MPTFSNCKKIYVLKKKCYLKGIFSMKNYMNKEEWLGQQRVSFDLLEQLCTNNEIRFAEDNLTKS